MGRTILITGTRRSGTREVAERIATGLSERVLRIVTAERMADIGGLTRASRTSWRTTAAPLNLLGALPAEQREAAVLIDCLSVWAGNRLVALGDPARDEWQAEVVNLTTQLVDEVNRVVRRARHGRWTLVLILHDVDGESLGSGHIGHAYRNLIGDLTNSVRDVADRVYTVVGGLPYEVKRYAHHQPV